LKKSLFFLLFIASSLLAEAQVIVGVSARYDNSFREWDIYDDSDAIVGEFVQRWKQTNDFSEWDLRYADAIGSVRQKWKNDNSRWELRINDQTITMKMQYPGDPNQWIITDNSISLDYATKYPYLTEDWLVKSRGYGTFAMSQYYEHDPRDWEVFDELSDDVSPAIRLALTFIALIVSAPHK
jgi:hypothetical protein